MRSNTFKSKPFDATNDYTELDRLKDNYNAMLDRVIEKEDAEGMTLDEMYARNPKAGCWAITITLVIMILVFAACGIGLLMYLN